MTARPCYPDDVPPDPSPAELYAALTRRITAACGASLSATERVTPAPPVWCAGPRTLRAALLRWLARYNYAVPFAATALVSHLHTFQRLLGFADGALVEEGMIPPWELWARTVEDFRTGRQDVAAREARRLRGELSWDEQVEALALNAPPADDGPL